MANIQDDSTVAHASLQMDFWSEELSESQKGYYSRSQKEYSDIMRKVSDFIFKEKGDVLERGSDVLVLQGSAGWAYDMLSIKLVFRMNKENPISV